MENAALQREGLELLKSFSQDTHEQEQDLGAEERRDEMKRHKRALLAENGQAEEIELAQNCIDADSDGFWMQRFQVHLCVCVCDCESAERWFQWIMHARVTCDMHAHVTFQGTCTDILVHTFTNVFVHVHATTDSKMHAIHLHVRISSPARSRY